MQYYDMCLSIYIYIVICPKCIVSGQSCFLSKLCTIALATGYICVVESRAYYRARPSQSVPAAGKAREGLADVISIHDHS